VTADCGLRIADFLNHNRQSEIAKRGERNWKLFSIRNPQSAIKNQEGRPFSTTRSIASANMSTSPRVV
jgi:hypothetical protein